MSLVAPFDVHRLFVDLVEQLHDVGSFERRGEVVEFDDVVEVVGFRVSLAEVLVIVRVAIEFLGGLLGLKQTVVYSADMGRGNLELAFTCSITSFMSSSSLNRSSQLAT